MNKKEFVSKIQSLKSDIITNDEFFVSDKKKFLNVVASEFGSNNIEKKVNERVWRFGSIIGKLKLPGVAIGTFAVVFSACGFTVSAALKSLPGDPLYSLKLSMEGAIVAMTFDDASSLNLQVRFAGNRIDELSYVLRSNRPNKDRIATDLVNRIGSDLSSVPDKVVALNNKKTLETTAKNFDNKINEYSDKLKVAKKDAEVAGMSDLNSEIDLAYMKGNSIAVKTLNIVVHSMDPSSNNDALKKDIIDRVEKKVDNITDVINKGSASGDVVNDDVNGIINGLPATSVAATNENGGGATIADQLQDMKIELQKTKINLATSDMASVINNIDKGLSSSIISTTPMTPTTVIITPTPVDTSKTNNADESGDKKTDTNKDDKDSDVKMQFDGSNSSSGYGYGQEKYEFQLESLWTNGK